ncbi:MAG: Flp pilus assembly protein CpaB [Azospirillaceae bacterium]|nr:Flp pilus assembly protein CpaB [Azospirillaceae bacterium]
MKLHRFLMLMVALILLGAGVLIAGSVLSLQQAQVVERPAPPPLARRAVMTASHAIAAGGFLQGGDITWSDIPENTLRPELFVKGADSPDTLQGYVVVTPIAAGQAIERPMLVSPREKGFLAAALTPGRRAISVAVDEVSGNAGLIYPGDHVDMLITSTVNDPGVDSSHRLVGEVVQRNIRVLAVDQGMRGATEMPPDKAGGAERRPARTVTIEVAPQEAERVAVASTMGHIVLILRSLQPVAANTVNQDAPDTAPVWAGDVLTALGQIKPAHVDEAAPAAGGGGGGGPPPRPPTRSGRAN